MTKLENLSWVPKWTTHIGCLKGCLDYLGLDMTESWLAGAFGHAFVLNIADGVCPSGPTAWNDDRLYELARNVGGVIGRVSGNRYQHDLAELQRRAWEHVTRALDAGLPCYGWELDVPEYYVVFGYDDVGYYYSGVAHDEGTGPKPWAELGDTGIGGVEMASVAKGTPASDGETVGQALAFALEFSEGPDKWVLSDSAGGLNGYRAWMRYLEEGRASLIGMGYNAAVWEECRRLASGFLREAAERLGGSAATPLRDAAEHYERVRAALAGVSKAYPFSTKYADEVTVPVDDRSASAVEDLGEALAAEEKGLELIRKIAGALIP